MFNHKINHIFCLLKTVFFSGTMGSSKRKERAPAEKKIVRRREREEIMDEMTRNSNRSMREEAAKAVEAMEAVTLADRIRQRMYIAWGQWQPDYEGWLKWSDDLYAADAMISAIGDTDQKFRDYQASMKEQRDACEMEMGPILKMIVEDNVAALVYNMYLSPKGMENAPVFSMMVTEYNTLEEVDGKLMVIRLDLFTDGGNLRR